MFRVERSSVFLKCPVWWIFFSSFAKSGADYNANCRCTTGYARSLREWRGFGSQAFCMMARGVKSQMSEVTTSVCGGLFKKILRPERNSLALLLDADFLGLCSNLGIGK